jgi:hypothetical protein
MRKLIILTLAAVAALALSACSGDEDEEPPSEAASAPTLSVPATATPAPPSAVAEPTDAALRNITYLESFAPSGRAPLVDGESREQAAPGSATEVVVTFQRSATGDLNRDGAKDAAVVLVVSPGGSGTFYKLAAVISDGGGLRHVGSVLLGDRVRINDVTIEGREIVVAILDRPAGAAFAEPPTIPVERRFRLSDGELHELIDEAGAACATALAGSETPLVIVASPMPGAAVSGAFTASGCSRTFEANVNWRLLALDGSELASGFATGGGVDGPATFEFSVTFSVDQEQRGLLEVFEEDTSGGEGFPPPRHSVPLLLLP